MKISFLKYSKFPIASLSFTHLFNINVKSGKVAVKLKGTFNETSSNENFSGKSHKIFSMSNARKVQSCMFLQRGIYLIKIRKIEN